MNKFLKILIILFFCGILTGTGIIIYLFNKPHRNLEKETPAYILSAKEFYSEFNSDEQASYAKYGNKAVQVSGTVSNVYIGKNSASITLLDDIEGINCGFDSINTVKYNKILQKLSTGDSVIIKGQCDGYDMIMGIVLTRCVIVD